MIIQKYIHIQKFNTYVKFEFKKRRRYAIVVLNCTKKVVGGKLEVGPGGITASISLFI